MNIKNLLTVFASIAIALSCAEAKSENLPDNTHPVYPADTEAENVFSPDGTYMFVQRDTCDLYLDIYNPAKGSETMFEGRDKPTIMFMFGGGFIEGRRDDPGYMDWFKILTDNGYRVISIDYRLGLKGSDKVGIAQVNVLDAAIHMAVEDLFSATSFVVENAEELEINPSNIVISGSSAGAISVLQAEYELCNGTQYTEILPEGFRYSGVMAFSGAVLSRKGKLKYAQAPAPTLMLHGTADKLVNYKQIAFFNLGFFGSSKIAGRFEKFGYNYHILRYLNNGHEIAGQMGHTTEEQFYFLENNVLRGRHLVVDSEIYDPEIVRAGSQSRKELYGN